MMLEGLSDIRWLGKHNSMHMWEVECQKDIAGTIDPSKLTVRLEQTGVALERAPDNPLRVLVPEGMRGGSFVVEYDGSTYSLISRQVPLEGASNCRDLGGYVGANQKTVCWRKLLRSGHWSNLSQEDVHYLGDLDITLICDFRSEEEQRRQPPKLPEQPKVQIASLPITPGSAKNFYEQFGQRLEKSNTEEEGHKIMREVNRELVLKHSDQYKRMFELILNNHKGASMINCTAGKDRTGFGAMLILLALGVSEKIAIQDYLKTRQFNKSYDQKWAQRNIPDKQLAEVLRKSMLTVQKTYIESALRTLHEQHGNTQNYLDHIGVDQKARDELQARFLV